MRSTEGFGSGLLAAIRSRAAQRTTELELEPRREEEAVEGLEAEPISPELVLVDRELYFGRER